MKLLVVFGCLLAATVCSSLPNQRIIVGVDTTISEIPWQVSINFMGHVCSGSIIAPRWVLTTASCVSGLSEQVALIRWGSSYHNYGGNLVRIEDVVINAKYNRRTYLADIALIKTSIAMTATPAQLANSSDQFYSGEYVTISGWGITYKDHGQFAKTLQKTSIPYIRLGQCRNFYDALNINLPEDMFCAGDAHNGGAGICRGDIGGPATIVDFDDIPLLGGIASFTLTCGGVGQPNVFTDVRPYRDWIQQVTGV